MRMNGEEVNLENTSNLNVARNLASESGIIMPMSTQSIEDAANTEAVTKFNQEVDDYVEKLEKHQDLLNQYTKEMVSDLHSLEIAPVYEGVLIKPYEENPFQRIKKEGNIIVDLGGQKPSYKSNDTGEWEEEESFIKVGLVIEVGPTCKYIKPGDAVMWRKPSETPVPFYKQGLVLVNEHSIMVAINEGLTERYGK